MPKGDKRTKKQHFIPQVYLRGFSPDYMDGNVENEKYHIYRYALNEKGLPYQYVPIKTICYKKDLYEVTGDDGNIVLPNHLEKIFSTFEKWFSEYRKKLERKASLPENLKTNCFLTSEEKVFWVTYIIVQILRTPQILGLAEEVGAEIWQDRVNDKQLKNIARLYCLPFFKELKEGDKDAAVFDALFEPMREMSFAIGVDPDGKLITSDKAVYIYSTEFPCAEYGKVIFPITSKLCLYMFGGDEKKNVRKNFLFLINAGHREEIIKSISASALENIYTNHILDKTERKYIKEIIQDRKER
ncbi:MAG: DUF4238 domain-containing protein [Butyrivibrio sp.]|nr:DUF4238 domain-containing protein [Butyrivibrio sp.]